MYFYDSETNYLLWFPDDINFDFQFYVWNAQEFEHIMNWHI